MKSINVVLLLLCSGLFISCLDVVEVDLEEATPRLVVDASIKWQNGESPNQQLIQLSKTRNFYDDEVAWVSGAQVMITDEDNQQFSFQETAPGQYETSEMQATIGKNYQLSINVEGQSYSANERLVNRTLIDTIIQGEEGGFSGDEKEVVVYFFDDPEEENYYLTRFKTDFLAFPEIDLQSDEFNNGNQMSASFSSEDLASGDVVEIEFFTISKAYHDFLFKLLLQTGSAGGPFQAQPASVRGNVVNIENLENSPFGYFSISTFEKATVIAE